ncbi:hypothetical protein EV361DRAFT_875004, partial [Lentinula raphanica]
MWSIRILIHYSKLTPHLFLIVAYATRAFPEFVGTTERIGEVGAVGSTNLPGKKPRTKYKPVHRKYRPVPTYFPDPVAQQFKAIPKTVPLELPEEPPEWENLEYHVGRMTKERMEEMLGRVEE